MQKHHILSQVAGYHVEVIKFLPPITITQEDMDWFLTGIEDVPDRHATIPGCGVGNRHEGWAKRTVMA